MKKIFLLSMVCITLISAQAQVGFKGGLNLSNWHGKSVPNDAYTYLPGFYLGAYGNVALNKSISVQTDLVFSEEGVKQKSVDIHVRLNYLKLSELVRYNVKNSRFFIGTGPELGFLMCAFQKIGGTKSFLKDEIKVANISWAFAAGYDLKFGLGFYAGYSFGLSNILTELGENAKQNNLQIGLRYNLKSKARPK